MTATLHIVLFEFISFGTKPAFCVSSLYINFLDKRMFSRFSYMHTVFLLSVGPGDI